MLQVDSGLRVELVVAQEGRPPRYSRISQSNFDAVTLIRLAAREALADVAPYRVTLARLSAQLDGSETNLSDIRAATESILARNWRPDEDTQQSAMLSVAAVLSLLEGDTVQAARQMRMAQGFTGASRSATALFALNAAFLRIMEGDLAEARAQIQRAIAASPGHPITNFPSYLLISRGLLAWAEHRPDTALELMQEALRLDPANRNALIYVGWLQHLKSGSSDRFNPAAMPEYLSRSPTAPGMMASVFLMDPVSRQVQRSPNRM